MGVKKKTLKFALEKEQIMGKDDFFMLLSEEVKTYKDYLETDSHDWIVKGFIDIDKNVYTISNDTKVVSKIIEILLIPKLEQFAKRNGMTLELPSKQNYYPDLTFSDKDGNLFAVDLRQELVNPIIMTFPLIRNILRDSRISCTS